MNALLSIVHVDVNAFFTSVEQSLDPRLKGRPVVTGKERGIVACASYEAKALGVKRPMPLFEARRICPQLVCLPSDYETYSLYSRRLYAIIRRFTPVVEEYSIDEAFAELSGLRRVFHMDYPAIAKAMKEAIRKELGLTVSMGLSASKTLAKLASQSQKPDGFTVVGGRELDRFLKAMPVMKVCGFGANLSALLNKHGVITAYDYVARPEAWAKRLLGKTGAELWHELRGEAVYPLVTEEKSKYFSIGKTKTFTPSSSDPGFVRAQVVRNLESAFIKLRRHGLKAGGILLHLREHDFRNSGLEAELERPTASTIEGARVAGGLFDKLFRSERLYRQSGVVLFRLKPEGEEQYSLFDDVGKIKAYHALDEVIDRVNALYGKHALHLATGIWLKERARHLTERGDVPERKRELLPGETARRRVSIPLWKLDV